MARKPCRPVEGGLHRPGNDPSGARNAREHRGTVELAIARILTTSPHTTLPSIVTSSVDKSIAHHGGGSR